MSNFYLTDEDIHGCEEDSEMMVLKNKLDKANERIEELEDTIKTIRMKIELDNKINKKCLQEEISKAVVRLLNNWVKYDNELLELLKEKE